MKTSSIRKTVLVILFWLAFWHIASMVVGRELILPSPYRAFESLASMMATGAFYRDVATTILRCIMGMTISFVAGTASAFLAYRFSTVRSLMVAPVLVFKATPVMAIILILLLSLQSNHVPVAVCFLMCFPVVYTNLLAGFDNIELEHIELSKFYRLGMADTLRFVHLPSVMPQISTSLNLIAGLSWKTVVAAEVLAAPNVSMGYNLFISKVFLQTANLFAWLIAIICLSMIFEKIIKLAIKQFLPKDYMKSKVVRGVRLGQAVQNSEVKGTEVKVTETLKTPESQELAKAVAPEIQVTGLTKSFGEKVVFAGFTEKFEAGKTTAIMAPSGYGKTTLFRIIAGLEKNDGGEITGISNVPISYLFQEDRLLPWLNVFDNIALFLKNKVPTNEIQSQTTHMLEMLELFQNAHELPKELSGGMKHRVAIGRAFLCPALILLLDEPFRGLDADLKNRIIPKLCQEYMSGKTVILVTHNQEDAEKLSSNKIIKESLPLN
jgi:NitT/TauT family transport system permease protein